MTAALLLAGTGTSVTLLERVANPSAVGAGLLLQPNGLAVLDGLGLGTAVRAAGHRLRRPALRGLSGVCLADLTPPSFGTGLDHLLAIHRARLHEILLDAIADRREIELRLGAQVTAARADGTVELLWHGRRSTITADLVVAADGADSTIREIGGFGAQYAPRRARYLRGLVDGQLGLEGEYWTPLGLFGGAPVDDTATYFYADATAAPIATALAAQDITALQAIWADVLPVAGQMLDRVASTSELIVTDVTGIRCRSWIDGRLALLGDAAHAMAPTVGQGANSAMVDAAVLAAELADDRGTSVPDALARYVDRRRAPVLMVQRRADYLARLAMIGNPLLRHARDWFMSVMARRPRLAVAAVRGLQQEDPQRLRDLVTDILGADAS